MVKISHWKTKPTMLLDVKILGSETIKPKYLMTFKVTS